MGGAGIGNVDFMLFVFISFALGNQREPSFQWNMGLCFRIYEQQNRKLIYNIPIVTLLPLSSIDPPAAPTDDSAGGGHYHRYMQGQVIINARILRGVNIIVSLYPTRTLVPRVGHDPKHKHFMLRPIPTRPFSEDRR